MADGNVSSFAAMWSKTKVLGKLNCYPMMALDREFRDLEHLSQITQQIHSIAVKTFQQKVVLDESLVGNNPLDTKDV